MKDVSSARSDACRRIERKPTIWLSAMFPDHYTSPMGGHHMAFWRWCWGVRRRMRPEPFLAVWSRGHGKSTNAEDGTVALGVRGIRFYFVYVCETQDQADDHVQNIGTSLASSRLSLFYPEHGTPELTKFGAQRAWRRNRLRTKGGLTIDALGLDVAARGLKMDEKRPDGCVLDDLDNETDTERAVAKKEKTLSRKILPALTRDAAIMGAQNIVNADGIFARISDGRSDVLADRVLCGPVPAVAGLEYEQRKNRTYITNGRATWGGMSLEDCQVFITTYGLSAFLAECQHEEEVARGTTFAHLDFESMRCARASVPELVRVAVWCDPAVTSNDKSDCQAICCVGLGVDGRLYVLYAFEQRTTPRDLLVRAIRIAVQYGADHVGVETDQGGETWESVYREALAVVRTQDEKPELAMPFTYDKAGGKGPKLHRAQQTVQDCETDKVRIVAGTHTVMEKAMMRHGPDKTAPPLDLIDAWYWAWRDLTGSSAEWFMRQMTATCSACGKLQPKADRCERCGAILVAA